MAEQANAGTTNPAANQNEKQVGVQRIYLKDSSFESPRTPAVFAEEWKPHINMSLNTNTEKLDAGGYEVTLTVTVDVKNNEKAAFLCEVQQSGVFILEGLTEPETQQVAGSFCPAQLYPYARAAIADLVSKGGFPTLTLQPINFEALLAQHFREVQQAQSEAPEQSEQH